jgi:sugar phosphate isomerase/epimerase
MDHPWSLEQKLRAIKGAGFDGVCWAGSAELHELTKRFDLIFVGGMSGGDAGQFPRLLREQKDAGALHVNVQLASDDVLTPQALDLTLALLDEAERLGLQPAIETHRGTCTETPEKMYALADAYEKRTGKLLPISWDFSHFAVVKHLVPSNFIRRLIVRPDLIQRAQHFHFRPFNGHHVQVPITDGRGNLAQEFKDWLPFAQAVLKCWLEGNRDNGREIFICPELGPVEGGYSLSTLPNSWEEAKVLRGKIDGLWKEVIS